MRISKFENYLTHVPKGEPNSVNELTRRAIIDPEQTSLEISNLDVGVQINVINNIQEYSGTENALNFAKQLIKDLNL